MDEDTTPAEISLHLAANAMHTAREVAEYMAHPPNDGRFGISVDWTWGREANKGAYAFLKAEITRHLEEQMPALIRKALDEALAIRKWRLDNVKHYLKT